MKSLKLWTAVLFSLLIPRIDHAQASSIFCREIRTLLAETAVSQAHWGVHVVTEEGTPLCGVNQTQLFRPASNVKLFTAAAGLALLDPAPLHTRTSPVIQAGETTLAGDLSLVGIGDPFLSERPLPYTPALPNEPPPTPRRNPLEDLADQLAAAGLKHITGDILGDDTAWPSEPYAPDWANDDLLWGYGAPVSALSIDDNKLALTVTPGLAPGNPASATLLPNVPFYRLDLGVTTSPPKTAAAIGIDRVPGSRDLRIFGAIPQGKSYTEDLSIDDPAEYAALTFKALLEARGIAVDGGAHARHRPALSTKSFAAEVNQPLHLARRSGTVSSTSALLDDVTLTLKVSQNLHAELLLRRLGKQFGDDGSSAQGARVVRQFLLDAGLHAQEFELFDGSGLSGHDLATPAAFTELLVFAARQPWFPGFKSALPIGGVDGSLAGRFPALKGRVFAKTGTTAEARALSGYVVAASGHTLVFSILVDDHLPGSTADRTIMDRIVETIAARN